MHSRVRGVLFGLLLIGLVFSFVKKENPVQAQTEGAVKLKSVSYASLGEAVRALKGKVVIVDVWATW